MVGRVAKAIKDADWAPEFPGYEAFARTAIAAMREPTEAMTAAGVARTSDLLQADTSTGYVVLETFTAMIDAALNEPPRPDATGTDRGRDEP